mmetsp:Transcript_15816/g.33437  ORF Transcript_15816/g.33437 Transcript_15816/m.33437 type:complete len:199 (+) Transcript_15816:146-742(+)
MMEDISLRTVESSSSKNDNDAAQVASAPAPSNANTGFSKMGRKIFSATLCCYTACDFEDPMVGCRGKSDGICINRRVCIDPSAEGFGVGILDDEKETNELFKVGAYCCTCAIKKPELKCASAGRLFCMTSAQSLPFDPDYVKEPICACCFLQCFPTVGCLKDAPSECPARDGLVDVGGGTITTLVMATEALSSRKMER